MTNKELTSLLGGWEGYVIESVERHDGDDADSAQLWVTLEPVPGKAMTCSGCGVRRLTLHDVSERWIRDLPVFDTECWLLVKRRRVACPDCGPKLEVLPWLERYARVTRRLAESVARLCRILPVKQVAEYFGLSWGTVKQIDKTTLLEEFGEVDLAGIEQIAIDEFAIQKGHRYATVVVEPRTRRVLWIGRGREREDVRPFFELLGEDGCRQLKACAMDMSAAYAGELKANCPQAEIVYDLFHVIVKYGREVIDRVRVDEANRLRSDKAARKVIKGSRWLLLRNRSNVSTSDRVRLDELLQANRKLLKVYVLKDDLKHLWDYRYAGAAERFWNEWYRRAMYSKIEPLKKFARNLKDYIPGILSHCRWPLHTSVLEGINNKIKVIKRMAYGFRDDEYFFLKVRQAFPGNQ